MSEITILGPGDTMIVGPGQTQTAGDSEVSESALSVVFPAGKQVRITRRRRNTNGVIDITVDHDQTVTVNGVAS